ncbi:MauE/DoxX family redox-associated membrane protein [Chloroflexota bacterium]
MAFQRFSIDILQSKRLTFIFRLLLGVTFLVFGASKLPDLAGFADTVISYKVLPVSLAVPFGYALPWAGVVVGLLLILGLGLRFVAPVAILIIASFIAGTAGSLYLLEAEGP